MMSSQEALRSFGRKSDKSKIDPNKELANTASSFMLPIIAQKEVADYLEQVVKTIGNVSGYLDTWEMLSRAKTVNHQSRCRW